MGMIEKLQNAALETAAKIKVVYEVSYAVEAKLLNAINFPPLQRKLEGYTNSSNDFYGFLVNNQIAGVIELDLKEQSVHIQSMVVDPAFFRRGIARKLITHALEIYDVNHITVETGAANGPATQLYLKNGFTEIGQYETDHGIRKVRFEMRRG
jgi:ribosomal protein S18 acetylase RimI-like enzyme